MHLRERLRAALAEDLGPGDITTNGIVPDTQQGTAHVVAKQGMVVSGMDYGIEALRAAAELLGQPLRVDAHVKDGDHIESGTMLLSMEGSLKAILVGERIALNLMMRACGIATHVHSILEHVGEATFRAVDTRKSTPLWRDLEKAAVRHGGGHNHRFGLFDGVLIKDNHIAAAGGVAKAVEAAKAHVHHLVKIEVEVTNLGELRAALEAGADGLLLDNMNNEQLQEAIAVARQMAPHAFLEGSGNMNAARMAEIAGFGLDVVSVGGFIHQARWADLSLRIDPVHG